MSLKRRIVSKSTASVFKQVRAYNKQAGNVVKKAWKKDKKFRSSVRKIAAIGVGTTVAGGALVGSAFAGKGRRRRGALYGAGAGVAGGGVVGSALGGVVASHPKSGIKVKYLKNKTEKNKFIRKHSSKRRRRR